MDELELLFKIVGYGLVLAGAVFVLPLGLQLFRAARADANREVQVSGSEGKDILLSRLEQEVLREIENDLANHLSEREVRNRVADIFKRGKLIAGN